MSGILMREVGLHFMFWRNTSTIHTKQCIRTTAYCQLHNKSQKLSETSNCQEKEVLYRDDHFSTEANQPLYEGHISTNCLQKSVLSVGAAMTSILNPWRHDMIAVLGETTGQSALPLIRKKMLANAEGERILRNKPRINSTTVDLTSLSQLPQDTLGYAYFRFLEDNNVTPDSRDSVKFVDDPDLAYVMQRYREVHDLTHTVLGMKTNMVGEVAVKWVEAIQTGLPMCIAGALFGPLRFRRQQRQVYLNTYLPWAVRVGQNSAFLLNIYFEERWEQSLSNFQNEFGIEPAPCI